MVKRSPTRLGAAFPAEPYSGRLRRRFARRLAAAVHSTHATAARRAVGS